MLNLRRWMGWIAKRAKGRKDTHVSYERLGQYRVRIIFWINHVYTKHNIAPLPRNAMYNDVTKVMRIFARAWNIKRTPANSNPSEVGGTELLMLVDNEMATTQNPDLSQEHIVCIFPAGAVFLCHSMLTLTQFAWSLARFCLVGPGSIGWSSTLKRDEGKYLKFKNVTIITEGGGRFALRIVFEVLKTNFDQNIEAANKSALLREMTCILPSPKLPDNLTLSAPYRMLGIALRRGLLDSIDTVDQLFACDKKYIHFKEEALDLPIVRASQPRGLSMTDKPASAQSLTGFLSTCGERLGFPWPINWLAIRRRSVTDMARLVGNDMARRLMNHDANSRMLEDFYLNLHNSTYLTALGLGDASGLNSAELATANNPAVEALAHDPEVLKVIAPAIKAMERKVLDSSDTENMGDKEYKSFVRCTRAAAKKAVLSDESEKMRRGLTRLQARERIENLEKSAFIEKLIVRARIDIKKNAAVPDEDDADQGPDEPEEHADDDCQHDEEEEDLEDLMDSHPGQLVSDKDGAVVREMDEQVSEGLVTTNDDQILYEVIARQFVHALVDAKPTTLGWKHHPRHCPLCAQDETLEVHHRIS